MQDHPVTGDRKRSAAAVAIPASRRGIQALKRISAFVVFGQI
jgi:hypothetical protein